MSTPRVLRELTLYNVTEAIEALARENAYPRNPMLAVPREVGDALQEEYVIDGDIMTKFKVKQFNDRDFDKLLPFYNMGSSVIRRWLLGALAIELVEDKKPADTIYLTPPVQAALRDEDVGLYVAERLSGQDLRKVSPYLNIFSAAMRSLLKRREVPIPRDRVEVSSILGASINQDYICLDGCWYNITVHGANTTVLELVDELYIADLQKRSKNMLELPFHDMTAINYVAKFKPSVLRRQIELGCAPDSYLAVMINTLPVWVKYFARLPKRIHK